MVKFFHIIIIITFVYKFLVGFISIVQSSYFKIFSVSHFIKFIFPEFAVSIELQVSSPLSRAMPSYSL